MRSAVFFFLFLIGSDSQGFPLFNGIHQRVAASLTTQTVILTSGSTWTVPAGVTNLTSVEVWGAGGGAASYNGGSRGGGGGGAYARINNFAVTPGATINVSIGTGGASNGSGSAGQAGGDTWFDSAATVMAKGGSGSPGGGSFNGGAGGSAASSVGTTKYSGGTGGNTISGWGGGGGGAAASPTGNGGNGTNSPSGNENGGGGGSSPGAGGGGTAGTGAATPTDGQAGASNANGGGGGGGGGADSNHSQAGGKGGAGGSPGGGGGSSGANSAANVADSGADGQIRIQYLGYSPTTAAPPAFVRQTPLTANATAASHSATFSALPSAGNMVVVYVATWYSSAHDVPTANVTDNNGNSYLLACKRVQSFGADHFVAAIFYAPAIQVTGGTFQVTASASTSSEMLLRAIEYSGLSSANALDQSVDNSATSSSATSGTTGTTSATYELLAGVVNLDSGGGVSITPTGGFTSRGSTSGGTNPMAGFADRIVSSTGTYQATWTLGSSVGYSACLATFK